MDLARPPHSMPNPPLGFLTVIQDSRNNLFGGYLVLNTNGRPLEFHCTAPVKPNRAQEILYGPTLEPYLYGEEIGQALLSSAKTKPGLVCTDREPALAVRQHVDVPVALVLARDDPRPADPRELADNRLRADDPRADLDSDSPAQCDGSKFAKKAWRTDVAHDRLRGLSTFHVGHNRLAVWKTAQGDRRLVTESLAELAETFDLSEPFERIREAIEEARRGAS